MRDEDYIVLKFLLSNKSYAFDFFNNNDPAIFSKDLYYFMKSFESYLSCYKNIPSIDMLKIYEKDIDKHGYIDKVFAKLNSIDINNLDFNFFIEKLKKKYSYNKILKLKESLNDVKEDNVDEYIGKINREISSIKNISVKKNYKKIITKNYIQKFKDNYNFKTKNPEAAYGIRTRYKGIDDCTFGINRGETLFIGGETGAGKSMLLLNMSFQMWLQDNNIEVSDHYKQGYNVCYFSFEMGYEECFNRFLSRLADVNTKRLKLAKLEKDEMERVKNALLFLELYPYQFEIIEVSRDTNIHLIEELYNESKLLFTPDIVVIDYLALMGSTNDGDDWLRLGKIAEEIHEFGRQNNCVMLSAYQLNKAKSKDMSDVVSNNRAGRSKIIIDNTNISIQLESRENEAEHNDTIWHITKNRNGALGTGKFIKKFENSSLLDQEFDDTSEFYDKNDLSKYCSLEI